MAVIDGQVPRAASARRIVIRGRGSSPVGASSGLPNDLRDRALHRLRGFCLIIAAVSATEAVVSYAVRRAVGETPAASEQLWDSLSSVVAVVVSWVVSRVVGARKLSSDTLTNLGTAYFSFIVFAVSFGDHSDVFWVDGGSLHGIPWVALIILAFPLVVPMSTRRTAQVALAMAACAHLAMFLVGALRGAPMPPAAAQAEVALPTLIAAVAAPWGAHVIHQLGVEVARARRLGAYTLEERLGAGGMGEVWRASHRFLARPAAIKVIRPEVLQRSDRESVTTAIERFELEAQATAALQSPHSIHLYDFGAGDDGAVYYVMELLDGVDLETFVTEHGPQPPERVADWLVQICHSLHEAHLAGLVHRDIKPANLFVCRYGAELDFIKVLDFGLVALQRGHHADHPRLTDDHKLQGTPAYMAPEAVTGSEPVDARADIYALGCVAYWLITGKLVFDGATPVELLVGHVDRQPEPPSRVTGAAIPEPFEQIVMACLEKGPKDRPQSARELAEGLRHCAFAQPWTPQRARDWWQEHAPAASD